MRATYVSEQLLAPGRCAGAPLAQELIDRHVLIGVAHQAEHQGRTRLDAHGRIPPDEAPQPGQARAGRGEIALHLLIV